MHPINTLVACPMTNPALMFFSSGILRNTLLGGEVHGGRMIPRNKKRSSSTLVNCMDVAFFQKPLRANSKLLPQRIPPLNHKAMNGTSTLVGWRNLALDVQATRAFQVRYVQNASAATSLPVPLLTANNKRWRTTHNRACRRQKSLLSSKAPPRFGWKKTSRKNACTLSCRNETGSRTADCSLTGHRRALR